jgi:hypothetical protein
LKTHDFQRKNVAPFGLRPPTLDDASDVLVEEGLDALDEDPALVRIQR